MTIIMESDTIEVTEFRGPEMYTTQRSIDQNGAETQIHPVGEKDAKDPTDATPNVSESTDTSEYTISDKTGGRRKAVFHLGDEPQSGCSSEETSRVVPPTYAARTYDNLALDVSLEDIPQSKRAVVSFVIDDDDWQNNEVQESNLQKGRTMAMTCLMSFMYGLIVIMVGFTIPLSEALTDQWLSHIVASIFNIYIYAGSSAFLVYIMFNIWMYEGDPITLGDPLVGKNRTSFSDSESIGKGDSVRSKQKEKEKDLTLYISRGSPSPRSIAGDLASLKDDTRSRTNTIVNSDELQIPNGNSAQFRTSESFASLSHFNSQRQTIVPPGDIYDEVLQLHQTATLGHDGASFYFRLGALTFGIANFIFVIVQLDHYINNMKNCVNPPDFYPLFFHLIFIIVQTFYIFKHTQVHVKKYKGFARFGFMHVLATNMCTWLRYLIFEVLEGIYHFNSGSNDTEAHSAVQKANASHVQVSSSVGIAAAGNFCIHVTGLYTDLAPYLFPFVLEYSLIATATMAGMYHSLNIRITQDIINNIKKAIKKRRKSMEHLSAIRHQDHGDMLAKSHRGMFAGAVLLGGAVVAVVMFHFSDVQSESLRIFYASDLTIHALMLPSLIYCAKSVWKFKFTLSRDNSIDNNLLMFALAGLLLYYIFILISTISTLSSDTISEVSDTVSALAITASFFNLIQGVLQGIFVVAGLQMCAANFKQQVEKPARGNITFLIIANLTVWIFKSFQVKAVDLISPVKFYGSTAWPIIKNTGLPLVLFYRFHVSVCLADMWISLYHPDTEPDYTVLS